MKYSEINDETPTIKTKSRDTGYSCVGPTLTGISAYAQESEKQEIKEDGVEQITPLIRSERAGISCSIDIKPQPSEIRIVMSIQKGSAKATANGIFSSPITVAIILYAFGPIMFSVLPVAVGAFTHHLGFSLQQAGYIASADLAGMFIGEITTALIIRRFSGRNIAILGCCFFIINNFLSAFASDFYLLALVRFLAEFGAGILMALSFTRLSRTDNPDRYFGMSICLQLAFTISLLLIAPLLLKTFGLKGFFLVLSVISAFTLLAVFKPLEVKFEDPGQGVDRFARRQDLTAGIAVFSILVYWIGIGAVWSFAELLGSKSGLSAHDTSTGLALSQVAGFFGALFTAWLAVRFGRIKPIIIALVLQIGAIALFIGDQTALVYTLAVSLFAVTWNVVLIYQLGIVADADKRGIYTALGIAAQALGVAIGPALAASMIIDNDISPILIIAVIAIIGCGILSIVTSIRFKKFGATSDLDASEDSVTKKSTLM